MTEKRRVGWTGSLRLFLARLLCPKGYHLRRTPAHVPKAPEPQAPPICSRCGFAYFGEHVCPPAPRAD